MFSIKNRGYTFVIFFMGQSLDRPLYSQKSSANLDFLSSFLQKVITPELKLTSPDDKQLIQVSPEVIEGIWGGRITRKPSQI